MLQVRKNPSAKRPRSSRSTGSSWITAALMIPPMNTVAITPRLGSSQVAPTYARPAALAV